MDWMYLTSDKGHWQVIISMVMNPQVS